MAVAKFNTEVLILTPTAPGNAPANSVYLDSSNSNALSTKTAGNANVQVGNASAQDVMVKTMQNLSGAAIPAGKPVSKKADGSIVSADSDAVDGQRYIGISLDAINNNATGRVLLVGPNVVNAVQGLGFIPGQDIYISESGGGYTNNFGSFTGNNDSVIKVGVADCSAGVANGVATDLIMFSEVVIRP
jgi:hypothetical protein